MCDGNLAALEVHLKQQEELDRKQDFIENRSIEHWNDIKNGDYPIEKIIELREIFFDNNEESDFLFRDVLAGKACAQEALFDAFENCEHVQAQVHQNVIEELEAEK